MNISLQNVDKVSALLTLKLEKADYQARVEKTLKTYRGYIRLPFPASFCQPLLQEQTYQTVF